MKKVLFFLALSISIGASAQKGIYNDSIDYSKIVAADTVIYVPLSKMSFGGPFSIEFEYHSLNADNSYLWVGCSNTGNTFMSLIGWAGTSADSVALAASTEDKVVNGHASGKVKRTVAPASKGWFSDAGFEFSYFAIKVKKGSVTSGKNYFTLRQK